MISGLLFFVGIFLLVVFWVAISYGVFLVREPDLAVDEESFFENSPSAPVESVVEAPVESVVEAPVATDSVIKKDMTSFEITEKEQKKTKKVFGKPTPRNTMNVSKKAKKPRRKN